ncbi:MAG: nucleotidyltransferase domain-containing protein, partial [Nanoarchaeota archaeon]|nr:nucleotidyltransferase domain-containing protein [Nanoarchaeota archaeon]
AIAQGIPGQGMAPREIDFNALKKKLSGFQKKLVKKYPFILSLAILPPNATPLFEEDEGMPREEIEKKPIHVVMIMPEDQYKNLNKIKPEVVKLANESGEKLWVHIKTSEVDVWNYGMDSKFEFIDALAASFPLYDKGFLGALRVSSIHKNLVLNWLNVGRVRYVATYGIFGSLVRGTADETSDVDVTVIIDDTDVKRMNRVELIEKLRGKIVYDFVREATALAGVKNILNVQVWLLTDFWQRVKDAEPVAFTFIRDGIPMYDRGTFIPWKRLLQMGKIKPSAEAIDLFMKEGDRTDDLIKRRMLDSLVDVFWGVVTPTQAMLMLAGHGPPVPKVLVQEVKKVLVDEEKLMSAKELKTLEKVVKMFKDYEHGTLKNVSGKEIDALYDESRAYVKKMKELRDKLEKRVQEHEADRIHGEVFDILKKVFGSKSQEALVKDFEKNMVKEGKVPGRMLGIVKDLAKLKQKVKSKKLSQSEMQRHSREASSLMDALTEYTQRKELVSVEKGIMQIFVGNDKMEIVATDEGFFVIDGEKIRVVKEKKLVDSSKQELEKAIKDTKDRLKFALPFEVLGILKKELGDFFVSF